MRNTLVAASLAASLASTALADSAYFDVKAEDGTQIGELKAKQDEGGAIKGGARFRDSLGTEPYGDVGGTEYELTGEVTGSTVTFKLSRKGEELGFCPMIGDTKPLTLANETRLLGTCKFAGLNGGAMFAVIMTPHQ